MLKHIDALIKAGADLNQQDENGKTLLMIAAEKKDISAATLLLKNKANPFLSDDLGQTALMKAVLQQDMQMVCFLAGAMGGRTNQRDLGGQRAIDIAREMNLNDIAMALDNFVAPEAALAEEEWFDEVSKALSDGLVLNGVDENGVNLLSKMIYLKYNRVAHLLIENGADINVQSVDGFTPLMTAVLVENEEMMHALLDKGADLFKRNMVGDTALDMAKHVKVKASIIELLENLEREVLIKNNSENDEDISVAKIKKNILNKKIKEFFEEEGEEENPEIKEELFSLNEAFLRMILNPVVVKKNFNVQNKEGQTPLLLAVLLKDKKLIDMLLRHGADVDFKGRFGETPLLAAVWLKNMDIIRHLINKGANVNVENENFDTPLMRAAHFLADDVSELLIENGADIWKKNRAGVSVIDHLVRAEDYERAALFKRCFQKGLNLSSVGDLNQIEADLMIHQAIKENKPPLILKALHRGANVNAIDDKGETALFSSVRLNRMKIFKTLLDKGADMYGLNSQSCGVCDVILNEIREDKDKVKYLKLLKKNGFDFKKSSFVVKKFVTLKKLNKEKKIVRKAGKNAGPHASTKLKEKE